MYDTQTMLLGVKEDFSSKSSVLYECDSLDLSILEIICKEPGSVCSYISQDVHTSKGTVLNRTANLETGGLIERRQNSKKGAYENYICTDVDLELLLFQSTREAINSNMTKQNDISGKNDVEWIHLLIECPSKPAQLFMTLFATGEKTANELREISLDSVTVQTIYSRLKTLISLNLVCRKYSDRGQRYIYIAQPEISHSVISECLRLQKFAGIKSILNEEIKMVNEYSNNSRQPASSVHVELSDMNINLQSDDLKEEIAIISGVRKKPIQEVTLGLKILKPAILETLKIIISSPKICTSDITDRHPQKLNNSTIHYHLCSLMKENLVSRLQFNRINGKQGRFQYHYTAIEDINLQMIEGILSEEVYSYPCQARIESEKDLEFYRGEQLTLEPEQVFDSIKATPLKSSNASQSSIEHPVCSVPKQIESEVPKFSKNLVQSSDSTQIEDEETHINLLVKKMEVFAEKVTAKIHDLDQKLAQAYTQISEYEKRFEKIESSRNNSRQVYSTQKLDRAIESL